jgi:DNA primase
MAHFPPTFLDEILARTDLTEIIGRHVELKRSGSSMMGLCPFHNEKSPSFSVSQDKQLFYCFGCGKGGGAFQFLMEHDGYSFPEAVEYLAEKAGLEVPEQAASDPGETERRNRGLEMLAQVADVFARQLASEKGVVARNYLKQRKLPEEIIRKYKLGYAPAGYGFMQHCFGTDSKIAAQLESIGVLFKGDRGYVDRFRSRLIFPIRDRRGKTVGFGGRVLEGDQGAKYLNSPETPFFHKSDLLYGLAEHRDEIRKQKMLLVVEGYMDVLALAAHDLPIGLAPLGTAIGERQILEILRLYEQPVFCFDGDRAGKQAAWRALERMLPILKSEHSPKFLYLPDGEDPDSVVSKEGREAFSERIAKESRPVLETWLQGLKNLAGQGADGRARMAKKADAMLATMQDDYLRQAWRQEVEGATQIQLQNQPRKPRFDTPSKPMSTRIPTNMVQEIFMAGLLQKPLRFQALPAEAKDFSLDSEQSDLLYTRAFSLASSEEGNNQNIAGRLQREFPEDQNVSRWINQEPVSDLEFSAVVLDMHEKFLQKKIAEAAGNIAEILRLGPQVTKLKEQRREISKQLEEQRRGI